MRVMSTFLNFKELPKDYITHKFYEYGFNVTYMKGNNTYNCGCPICMEGRSFGKKKRCWYLVDKNQIHCFNCGRSYSPYEWIRIVGNITAKDIKSEIESGQYDIVNLDKKQYTNTNLVKYKETYNLLGLPDDCIDLNNELEVSHYKGNSAVVKALKYLEGRRLNEAINRPTKLYLSLNDYTHHNRIIFPFFENKNSVPFYQSRSYDGNIDDEKDKIRYLSKSGAEKSVFNLDKITNEIDDIFIFEGPIDACFCRNGVAVAGITESGGKDLTQKQKNQLSCFELTHRLIWMLDSQYLDETSLKKTEKLLRLGECVFIWPENEGRKYKDFNEWCIAEGLNEIPVDFIKENVRCQYSELMMMKFKKDWVFATQSSEEDFYGDFNPSVT